MLLLYWCKCDDTTLHWAVVKGRDHAGRAGGKRDGDGHVLGGRGDLLPVGGWRWLGLRGRRDKKKKEIEK